MWNCWECCRCFRQSPKNPVWGYACDAAKAAGFRNISIQYWLDSDPYRPKEWDEVRKKTDPDYKGWQPGPISIYSTLCEQCNDITLKEYFDMLAGFARRHDYRHHGGAGGGSNMCRRSDEKNSMNSWTICANCRREVYVEGYTNDLKAGWILVGCGEGDIGATGMSFCPECPRKLTINDVVRLYAQLKPVCDKEWQENWNKWEADMEKKWGPDWRTPKVTVPSEQVLLDDSSLWPD